MRRIAGMKLIKRILGTALVALFCFSPLTAAQAAIIWQDIFYVYEVEENNADVYNVNNDPFTPAATLEGPRMKKTNTDGGTDPVTAKAISSTPTDPTGLGLQFEAGAGGQLLANGARLEGYAATSTTSTGVLDPYAVGSWASQTVSAFLNRNFHVDSSQAAIFSAAAGGVINDPEFFVNGFLRADYTWEGVVALDEIVTRNGFPLIVRSWSINFDDLLDTGTWKRLINLRTQDQGDPISYTLRTKLDLASEIDNTNPRGGRTDDIPVGALGSLGSRNAPVHIEATINDASPTCEADFDGDQDVDGEDLDRLKGGQESISVADFALEFGRTNCL
jgi:hypothetical protein